LQVQFHIYTFGGRGILMVEGATVISRHLKTVFLKSDRKGKKTNGMSVVNTAGRNKKYSPCKLPKMSDPEQVYIIPLIVKGSHITI
jgi:hypothetical protein